ncbi:calcium-binding protein, partial [Pseudomonas sp. WHRI 8822A]|uniref:calcium-binding protein n=1 Tax=Pseudomonas sp. WHRI 8822A TaxID=3162568 RepID=UPI0032EE9908
EGDDVLTVSYNSWGNVLEGGKGNDTLYGSYNADTYVFNLGDGHDTIIETSSYSSVTDVLSFGAGISASDIQVHKQGVDLVFVHANGTDKVQVKNWFASDSNANAGVNDGARLERVDFADGSSWTQSQIEAAVITLGTEGGDKLVGWSGTDVMYGGAGNDTLDGGTGNNHLYGGEGDDVLTVSYNSWGNVLEGGKGNDTLYGSYNADTYVFNLGDGHDT